jgi:hypothetical protein
MGRRMNMISKLFIFFSILTMFSLYSSYSGLGLEEIKQTKPKNYSNRTGSSHSYSNGGWSFGK